MVEANPVKFYFAKYFFLVFCFLQWAVTGTIFFQYEFGPKSFFIGLVFFTLGMISFTTYLIITDKVRRVAIGKNKIIVTEGDRNIRFEWPEVKSLKIIPFLNLYKLKLKGKRGYIYFFPSQNIDPAFGLLSKDTSKMGDIVQKRKKELGIK
jgi:hypothetical protein